MQRFMREARAASALNHPNVATIYDVGEATECASSPWNTWKARLWRRRFGGRPVDTRAIVEIGGQVADALEAAHAKEITHRDIKPANLDDHRARAGEGAGFRSGEDGRDGMSDAVERDE